MFYRQKNSFYRFFNIKYGFTIEGKEKRVNLCTIKKRKKNMETTKIK